MVNQISDLMIDLDFYVGRVSKTLLRFIYGRPRHFLQQSIIFMKWILHWSASSRIKTVINRNFQKLFVTLFLNKCNLVSFEQFFSKKTLAENMKLRIEKKFSQLVILKQTGMAKESSENDTLLFVHSVIPNIFTRHCLT